MPPHHSPRLLSTPYLCVFSKQDYGLVSWSDRIAAHSLMNLESYETSFSVEFSQALNGHATCMTKVISEVLGHASVAFTMDTYSHIISGMQEDMMALLDEVLPSGKSGVNNKINSYS